ARAADLRALRRRSNRVDEHGSGEPVARPRVRREVVPCDLHRSPSDEFSSSPGMWRGGACGNRRPLDGHDDTARTRPIERVFPFDFDRSEDQKVGAAAAARIYAVTDSTAGFRSSPRIAGVEATRIEMTAF